MKLERTYSSKQNILTFFEITILNEDFRKLIEAEFPNDFFLSESPNFGVIFL